MVNKQEEGKKKKKAPDFTYSNGLLSFKQDLVGSVSEELITVCFCSQSADGEMVVQSLIPSHRTLQQTPQTGINVVTPS